MTTARWSAPPPGVASHGGAHLWAARVGDSDAHLTGFEASLSPEERERAAAFRFDIHRLAYVVAHGVLRDVLARYLDVPGSAVPIVVDDNGRPGFPDATPGVDFNLSHAGDLVVVAVVRGQRVGIDVEVISEQVPHQDLAARFFAPAERDRIGASSDAAARAAFFACWTKKEALVKGVGRGLSMRLSSFAVTPDSGRESVSLGPDGIWTVTGFDVAPGYAAAVALERDEELCLWSWEPAPGTPG